MKQVHPNYSFVASTKTITLTGLNIPQGQLLLITNATRGVIYYNFASSSHRATVTAGADTQVVLTDASTTGHLNSDQLIIHYEDQLTTQAISAAALPLPAGAATSANQTTTNASLGATNETAAINDTATSGINGLLKRLLQRITTLIYPPFSSGSFDNSGGTSSAIDCAGYDYLVQHVSGGGGGYTRPVQWSNDNTNWTSSSPAAGTYFYYETNNSGWETLQGNMGTSSGLFVFPVLGRYWRITTGGSGGGSWTHRWYLHKGPFPGILEDSLGSKISSAASSDTDNTGLIGLFKRLLQRITTLVPANLTVSSTRLLVDGSGVTQPISGTITANAGTNLNTSALALETTATAIKSAVEGLITVVGSGSFTAAQATHANLKAQAQILDSVGNQVTYIQAGTAGTPSANVLSVQGVASGTALPVSPIQGTIVTKSNFSLTSPSSVLASANANRQVLTIFNEGAGNLHISAGASCTTTSYQVRLSAGDYYEVPLNQTSLTHSAVFATAGTARVTEVS